MSNYYDPGTGKHVMVDGMIVERDALRVAEAIKDYDPNLEILCVDPEKADISDEPFVIAERGKDGVLRPVLRAWVLNDLVLQRIIAADGHKHNGMQTLLDLEAAEKKKNQARYAEIGEERRDVIKHIAGIRHKYTVRDSLTGDLLTFYDDRPATRK